METHDVNVVGTYHVHTSNSISSIFSLYNRFAVSIKPVPEFPLQLFRNKLSLSKVVVPGVIAVAENYITERHLEKNGRDQRPAVQYLIRTYGLRSLARPRNDSVEKLIKV